MHPEKNKVVIDTNIVISAAISLDGAPADIFELLLFGKIVNYTSHEILEELHEVINRPYFKQSINEEYKQFVLNNFEQSSIIINPQFNEQVIIEDDKDNKFINCALTAKADIISGDAHLKKLKSYKGVKIWDANSFLQMIETGETQ